jgi:aspartate-semialdehyde dehydrogenase
MSGAGLRIVVVGATGALGTELLSALGASSLPISELELIATETSIGTEIEFRGDLLYVSADKPSLTRTDLLICCTPAAVALDLVRDALRAEVPCIDCSGVLSSSADVPLAIAELSPLADVLRPVVATPSGAAIGWAFVLHALAQVVGLSRVVGTVLQPASHAGLAGIDVLSSETIALLSQSELGEPHVFSGPIAFDCLPTTGSPAESVDGASVFEARMRNDLSRLLGKDVQFTATGVQVPTFVGEGSTLSIETERPLSVDDALAAFEKAPGIELRETAPSTRDAAGSTEALVGRVRSDPSHPHGLQLWVVTDGLCLAAANVVKLAEARLRVN